MSNTQAALPPLPEPTRMSQIVSRHELEFTADQMRAYGEACARAALAQAEAAPTEPATLDLLDRAWSLIQTARSAAYRQGLRDRGSDCRLPHEVRMFALAYSEEGRDGPGLLQVRGTGEASKWLKEAGKVCAPKPGA